MKTSANPIVLTDPKGVNWRVVVYHDKGIRQLFTEMADEQYDELAKDSVIIEGFAERFKIKIGSDGRLVTYKLDDLG